MLKDLTYMLATSSIQEGEMIESASTADILFWLIHLLTQYKILLNSLFCGMSRVYNSTSCVLGRPRSFVIVSCSVFLQYSNIRIQKAKSKSPKIKTVSSPKI